MKKQIIAFVITLLSTTAMASDRYPERPEVVDYPVSSGIHRDNLFMAIQAFKVANEDYTKGVTFVVSPKENMDADDIQAQTEMYQNGTFIIRVLDNTNIKELPHILFHEMAHVAYRRDLPFKIQRLYARIYRDEPACISPYSCEYGASENFAEWTVWAYHRNDFVGRSSTLPKMRRHETFFRLYQNYIFPVKGAVYGG